MSTIEEPSPPTHASPFYKTLFTTATEFVHAQDLDPTQPNRISLPRIHAIRSPTHTHSFGHTLFVSTKPPLQGAHTTADFIARVSTVTSKLESWDTIVTDVLVDEVRKMCVVRASYYMCVKSAAETVENDIVWFLWMDGQGQKVERATEFVDGVAAGRIGPLLMTVNGEEKLKSG